ncbi:Uncharacterised protein [Chryseobacterium indologenes]|nr:Uncharacterised protein [Chryseobacterium indologenes]
MFYFNAKTGPFYRCYFALQTMNVNHNINFINSMNIERLFYPVQYSRSHTILINTIPPDFITQ